MKKRKLGKKLLSFLLTLAMVVGLMPGMSMTAYADNTCTVTFKANGRTVSKEVTLPHTFSCNYSSENGEFDLIIKELYQLDGGCCGLNPPTVSGSTNVTGGISGDNQYITVNAPFEGTATFDSVYFDSSKGYMDFEIHLEISCTGAVAAYSVTITPGSNMTKTSGEASQTGLSGPMTDVVYTANEGYYFPENYSVAEVNGISVTRDSYTQITVSGTPTADAAITLTAPTEKTTPAAPTTAAAVDCTTSDNNDGKLTGVTAAMEYKKSDAADWTAGTGSDITGLVPGTYYVRVKATDTTNASGNQELTINAAQTQTDTLLTTITATDKEKASYNPENVASVSFSYTAGGSSAYLANWGWWGYGWTATVNAAEGYTITKCVFYDDANRKATDSEAPFVVETTEEDKTPRINGTPIDGGTSQSKGLKKIEVYGYATPAATHSVTITAGDNMTKTADSGDAEQTGLTGAMTDVVYTADDGYYFPTDYSVAEVSGIKVTRDSYTQITVSGTPTADAAIALTAPTAKTTPDAPTTAAATDCTTADNNNGKLTGVTTAMEYKKSDAESWTDGTGSDIENLAPGTYYVRVKATDTANASANQELTIKGFISYTVTFKVVNGKWNEGEGDAATADKTVTLTGHDGDTLKLTADQIPAVGTKPNDTYKAGSWDVTPSAETEITGAITYTYTYAQKDTISQTVTFKVINGKWDDDTTADKTVTLTGYEGDTLKLAANQIPAVGSKPNDTYKAGSWDVTPSTETAITEATTYTYTYAQKDSISRTVTFKVINGSWNDETTADKTVTLTGYEGDTLKLAANQIPAVGSKPSDTYKAGNWDVTPSTETAITADTTYTYTYAQKDSISQTVTFKVENGKWDDETTADKTVTLTGYEGDTLKLAASQIPTVGTKPSDTYKAGSWDVTPSTDTAITEATTYTYTYAAKEASVVTKAPEAKTLTYNGQAQELVTAGTATGGTMQYALGTANEATEPYTTSIPAKTDVGTYYVWYKVVGDANHNSTEPNSVEAKINPVDKTDLNTAIEEAEAYYESIKEDDVYAQVAEALKKAIDEAKKYTNDNVAEKEVKEAIDTIKAAKVDAEEGKKEADDTVVANEVADAINALPDGDEVEVTDKEKIEVARKAYDALTDDQKAKVPADTLKKLEDAEKALADAEKKAADDAKKPKGKNEWIDGQWYGADGNTDYKAKGSWKQNDKGWWYEDTDGWYPKSQWQKIDGKWYYFTADGYMDYSEYRDGYWLGSDGAWDETYSGGHWMQDSTGWWYVDSTGWYPVNQYLWVDGVQYWFNANGYWE